MIFCGENLRQLSIIKTERISGTTYEIVTNAGSKCYIYDYKKKICISPEVVDITVDLENGVFYLHDTIIKNDEKVVDIVFQMYFGNTEVINVKSDITDDFTTISITEGFELYEKYKESLLDLYLSNSYLKKRINNERA